MISMGYLQVIERFWNTLEGNLQVKDLAFRFLSLQSTTPLLIG